MKKKLVASLVPLLSMAACSLAGSGGVITPEVLARSAAECGHQNAKVGSIRTSTGASDKTVTIIEISSETMQLSERDRCLQKKLQALGSNFEMKLVSNNVVSDKPR